MVQECVLDGRRIYRIVDLAFSYEDGLQKLSDKMSCRWGKNETFALLKVLIDEITTVFPNDIPSYKTLKQIEKKDK